MKLRGVTVNLDEPATFYENSFVPGMFFSSLSQALRHAVLAPLSRKHEAARIVTQSGAQYGWDEINLLHDHLRNVSRREPATTTGRNQQLEVTMPIDMNQPAIWFQSIHAEGVKFDSFRDALEHALSVPKSERNPKASIATESGVSLDWEHIEELRQYLREEPGT